MKLEKTVISFAEVLFFFLAMLQGVLDLINSSPTRDQTCTPCTGGVES